MGFMSAFATVSVASGIVVATVLTGTSTAPTVSGPGALPAVSAEAVVNSIGVNIHENYVDTTYARDGDPSATLRYVKSLGVTWIRTGIKKKPPAFEGQFLRSLNDAGIKVMAIVGDPVDRYGDYALGESANLVAALTTGPYAGHVQALELPNEADLSGVPGWASNLERYDTEYYAALKAAPATREIPIVGPSMGRLSNCGELGAAAQVQDLLNIHTYTGRDAPETWTFDQCWNAAVASGGEAIRSQPAISSEFGWNNDLNDEEQGVSESAAATYMPRALIWNYFNGASRSFIYELCDQKPDPGDLDPQQHFGLVRVTGDPQNTASWSQSAKPAFTAVARLIARLRDARAATQSDARVTVTSAKFDGDVAAYVMRRSDGSLDVAYWTKEPAGSGARKPVVITTDVVVSGQNYAADTGALTGAGSSTKYLALVATPSLQIVRLRPAR